MSTLDWLRIFLAQRAALHRRLAYAIVFVRMAEFCRAKAAAYGQSAMQAASLAEQAVREYARGVEGCDEFDREVSRILDQIDARDQKGAA